MQDEFLSALNSKVRYWAKEARTPDVTEKLQGLVHSILVYLDGHSGDSRCGFEIVPCGTATDKEVAEEEGSDYAPVQELPEGIVTIHGGDALHEAWGQFMRGDSHGK